MKKILLIIITLTFLVSGCHTLFMYDTPTGYTKYTNTIIVDTYYPYYYYSYYSYYYPYYSHRPYYGYYHNNYYHNNHYVPNHNKKEINSTKERTKETTKVRNNSSGRNTQTTRKR